LNGVGEILLRGPSVSPGYLDERGTLESALTEGGFVRTGDLGFVDRTGNLHVVGRMNELMVRDEDIVHAGDIDEALLRHEAVDAAKTFGVPDERVGERIHTVCVARATETALTEWLRARLSRRKWPDQVSVLGYLPKTPGGKPAVDVLRRIVTGDMCNAVFEALNRRRDKRAEPSDPDRIQTLIQRALLDGRPLDFLSFWGCGQRDRIADVDRSALERLNAFVQRAATPSEARPRLTLLITDMHARINGMPKARYERYISWIEGHARSLGMNVVRSSAYWKEAGLSLPELIDASGQESFRARWGRLSIKNELVAQARKHAEGTVDYDAAARLYYAACIAECRTYERVFPSHIFLTYNDPKFDELLPPLPKIYLYSLRAGESAKPWFTDG
jgi:hypothetical protein